MAQYTQVLGAPKNRLLIDGVEVDLFNKRAIIDSYSKGSWDSVDITSSKTSIRDSMVLYHGELHFIGSSSADPTVGMHCKFDGTNWTSNVSTLPYNPSYCKAIVLNDEIHIFGGGCTSLKPTKDLKQMKYHYKWDDVSNTWTKVSTLPYYFFNGSAVIINGQVHLLGGGRTDTTKKKHYYFNGKSWKAGKGLPLLLFGQYQAVLSEDVYYNDYLVVYGKSTSKSTIPVYNGLDIRLNKWAISGGNEAVPGDIPGVVIFMNGSCWRYEYKTDKVYDRIVFGGRSRRTDYRFETKLYDDYIGMSPDYISNLHMIFFKGKLCIFGENATTRLYKSSYQLYTLEIEDK